MKAPLFTFSDAIVVAIMTGLFAVVAALIHYSGIMHPGSALF